MPKPISPHISYDEATKTNTGLKNEPNETQLENIRQLAFNVFEPLRLHFGKPININSIFRSEIVNNAVKGAKNSQHLGDNGAAMDIDNNSSEPTNEQIFNYIKDNLTFDQIINEQNFSWVHVSYKQGANRKQILKID